MAGHRPLSAWVARILSDEGELGAVNDGDERADARHSKLFADGWRRVALRWNGRSVLGLRRLSDNMTIVELDQYGMPIVASAAAVEVIGRAEEVWPHASGEIAALADEQLPLRYWVLERLDDEGEPPDEVFAILPWELLDGAAEAVSAALRPGGGLGELVEVRHWLTPAVRGLSGPLEQLDHGLRSHAPEVARAGATTLLTNLRDMPLSRIPGASRAKLGELVSLLGGAFPEHRDVASVVVRRLDEGADAVPDDASAIMYALVVPNAYLAPGDEQPDRDRARIDFGDSPRLFGPDVAGRVWRRGGELRVTVTGFRPGLPPLAVDTGKPGATPVPLVAAGGALRASIAWDEPDLPRRLIFRAVTQ